MPRYEVERSLGTAGHDDGPVEIVEAASPVAALLLVAPPEYIVTESCTDFACAVHPTAHRDGPGGFSDCYIATPELATGE